MGTVYKNPISAQQWDASAVQPNSTLRSINDISTIIPFDAPLLGEGSPLPEPWTGLGCDAVYLINLYERTERLDIVRDVMKAINLDTRTTLLQVDRHADGFLVGCWSSHRQVAMHALSRGYSRVLIFEDDLQLFDKGWESQIPIMKDILDNYSDKECERLMLGYIPVLPYPLSLKKYGMRVLKGKFLCTHAYVANYSHLVRLAEQVCDKEFVDSLSVGMYNKSGIDYWLREVIPNRTFAMFPPLVRQSQVLFSDHEGKVRPVAGSRFQSWQPFIVMAIVAASIAMIGGAMCMGILILVEKKRRVRS